MTGMWVVLLVIAAAAIIGGIVWAVMRHRYIKAFEALGWTFVNTPAISIVHGLNNPPFGLGFDRKVDEQVIGTAANGTPFQAFEYKYSGYSAPGFVVMMPLPHSMPEFHLAPLSRGRAGTTAPVLTQNATHVVMAADPAHGQAVTHTIQGFLGGFTEPYAVDLSIDHDQLVAFGAPTDAQGLKPFVDALAPLAQALSAPQFQQFAGPAKPAELSVYGRDDWVYRVRDDSMLNTVRFSTGGHGHRALNIIFSTTGVLPFVRLTHLWETTRTVTESDGKGGTRTRTVTDHHSEEIFEFHPTFPFNDFKVNEGWFGNKRTFEWDDFNQQFKVRASDARFAHDIFHPRMMEYLMRIQPGPFMHDGAGHLTIDFVGNTNSIESAHDFLIGFFARVPNFVWQNLGMRQPPLPLHDYSLDPARPAQGVREVTVQRAQ